MKKIMILMFSAGVLLTSCEKKATEEVVVDANENEVVVDAKEDVVVTNEAISHLGTFEGTLPCADCEGIKTNISLKEDGTYTEELEYLGKESDNKFSNNGTFKLNNETGLLELTGSEEGATVRLYKITEGNLVALDAEGKEVEGEIGKMYILNKK